MAERPFVATYRWQLTPEAGFAAAATAVPDLAALGISHLYLSPIAESVPGSAHGYDVVDPAAVRAELGGEDGLHALAEVCRRHGLGLIVDVVPNHLAAHPANHWWWDVLRLGPRARWAVAFDIDWDPPKRELAEQVLLPILGDHYGRELEAGRLVVEPGDRPGRLLVVRYHEHELPLSPAATATVLAAAAEVAADDVLGVAARVLARTEDEVVDLDARDADLLVAERTALGRLADPAVGGALAAELAALNGNADRLDRLLERQHYRLAYWRIGAAELDYRRFFDITSLVGTRVERPAVFEAMHELPLRLVGHEIVDGLRVDHVDGLRDPSAYLDRLAKATPGASVWIEKILRPGEALPLDWPVAGTTGYGVADLLGAWLTDPVGGPALVDAWRALVDEPRSFGEVAVECRRLVLETSLRAEVERLTELLVAVCEGRRRQRDHARVALRRAVVEVAAHAPAYRSYVRFDGDDAERVDVHDGDHAFVAASLTGAAEAAPDIDPELLELLGDLLLGRLGGPVEREVALRFQQLTGPVAAKGEEDTALYRWLALPHRCEVGADPARVTATADEWHAACAEAQAAWPGRLTSLSTHDTKRAADVRARLAALTTDHRAVLEAFERWRAAWRGDPSLEPVEAGSAWLVFHTLVGAHPLPAGRAWTVIEKSLREAKDRTTWTDPDPGYEAAVQTLVERSCADTGLRTVIAGLASAAALAGQVAALAQLALQLCAPGVPDVYQGGEGWDLSLVDPDNRRGVDASWRHEQIERAAATSFGAAWTDRAARDDGLPRACLLREGLRLRARHAGAFGGGDAGAYLPLRAGGPDADRVVAFARGTAPAAVVVTARPGADLRVEADASVALPAGVWRDMLHGGEHEGRLDLAPLPLPLALLQRSDP